MTATTADRQRAWQGLPVLSFGFRPFFLAGAVWAALAMVLWVASLSGRIDIPGRLSPADWHAHEVLFGYLGAVIAGFLLTAVPNWTGRLPVVGWSLAGLVGLWLAGRVAVMWSAHLPVWLAPGLDLAFPAVLSALILREIVAGRTWRNLPVLALLALFGAANLVFHLEAASGGAAAQGPGLRLGLAAALMMIALIGGRIVPSFTGNWIARTGRGLRPVPPMQRFDKVVLGATLAALVLWVARPDGFATGATLLAIGALHLVRLARWQGHLTGPEALVWVLHAGYGMVPLGALALGLSLLVPGALPAAVAQHVWMGGALGLMTLAVMTRATLGHTGRDLHGGLGTQAIYLAVVASVAARLAAGIWPDAGLLHLSGTLWVSAFAGFAGIYGPMLLSRRAGG